MLHVGLLSCDLFLPSLNDVIVLDHVVELESFAFIVESSSEEDVSWAPISREVGSISLVDNWWRVCGSLCLTEALELDILLITKLSKMVLVANSLALGLHLLEIPLDHICAISDQSIFFAVLSNVLGASLVLSSQVSGTVTGAITSFISAVGKVVGDSVLLVAGIHPVVLDNHPVVALLLEVFHGLKLLSVSPEVSIDLVLRESGSALEGLTCFGTIFLEFFDSLLELVLFRLAILVSESIPHSRIAVHVALNLLFGHRNVNLF